ncbi:cation channel family transporter, putative (macronuclear) [Tetrahymena thermophila SB210]|uniref:Cation channel family transporter, putative n=1 Tax=Tetrahymena thermophila (strain SB210) TaxID=312017 RepID=W7X8X0_TETTS|nr:cation channel family transporter, putative [Tetrahymena thermophila SB210]EWS75820.1 cation channel family transporter, putative [Tetrahymena thermophila SB210]|eukprot:XP_012651634.1 cation channel family transporter, putative [Tetrahymena thermophila SB210]
MSIQDIQVIDTRHKQGDSIKSKDWEQLRKKIFQEDESLWNDTQLTLNGFEEHKFNINLNENMQKNNIMESKMQKCQIQNVNSRRLKSLNRLSFSRSKINQADLSNKYESYKQTDNNLSQKEFSCASNYWQNTNRRNTIKINTLFNTHPYFFRNLSMLTKIKLKMKHFLENFTNIQRSRLLNSEMRSLVNDQSDILEIKDDFVNNLLINFNKCSIFKHFQIPLFKLSSRIGFYTKLILTLINIIYLLFLSIFFVYKVEDYFSKIIKTFINFF